MERGTRGFRKYVYRILSSCSDEEEFLKKLGKIPPKKVINPLISFFYHGDPHIRERAVYAFGRVMAALADEDMEAARIVMRRLMWSLNDESGGIGWGAPEAMAEAMAQNGRLAEEYVRILLSYIWEEGNYLEHDPLRRGALKGVARLAEKRTMLLKSVGAVEKLQLRLNDNDQECRALAAKALSTLNSQK